MSEITMVPDTMAELSGEDAEKVQKMLDALDDCDDVQDVLHQADLPEDGRGIILINYEVTDNVREA